MLVSAAGDTILWKFTALAYNSSLSMFGAGSSDVRARSEVSPTKTRRCVGFRSIFSWQLLTTVATNWLSKTR